MNLWSSNNFLSEKKEPRNEVGVLKGSISIRVLAFAKKLESKNWEAKLEGYSAFIYAAIHNTSMQSSSIGYLIKDVNTAFKFSDLLF